MLLHSNHGKIMHVYVHTFLVLISNLVSVRGKKKKEEEEEEEEKLHIVLFDVLYEGDGFYYF